MAELRKEVVEALRFYTSIGWAVFPCINSDDEDVAKRPFKGHGFYDATKDYDTALKLFSAVAYNEPLIGVATGKISGITVVDVDIKKGKVGDESLKDLEAKHGKLPETAEALSWSKGRHIYFKYIEGVGCSQNILGKDIDIRSDGGYIIVPPSSLQGKPYEWEASSDIKDVKIIDAPDWFVTLLKAPKIATIASLEGDLKVGIRDLSMFKVACIYRDMGYPVELATKHLLEYNQTKCKVPLPEKTIHAKIKSAYSRKKKDFTREIIIEPELSPLEAFLRSVSYNLTNGEAGLAALLKEVYINQILYTTYYGWLLWNGKYWQKDDGKLIFRKVYDVLDILEKIGLETKNTNLLKMLCKINKYNFISATLSRLSVLRGINVSNSVFNKPDTYRLFNCKNGTFNLKTGQLQPFNPKDYLTGMSGITFDDSAECPEFEKFLNTIYQNNQDTINYILRYLGYVLTAETSEQSLALLGGMGQNGKSQLLVVMQYLLGDYYYYTNSDIFIEDSTERRLAMAQATTARLMFAGEFNDKRFDESFIKSITGGEKVSARLHHKEPFTYFYSIQYILSHI